MGVPLSASTPAMEKLHEANAAFHKPPRRQTLFAESFALWFVNSVHFPGGVALFFQLQGFGNRRLHLERELVRFYSATQVSVIRIINAGNRVEFAKQA